ncbi:MAG: hypothetical protein M3337_06525 [Actinomycetota bacterium]|nr:hypothetical protein [Actinomycetota bacterium]
MNHLVFHELNALDDGQGEAPNHYEGSAAESEKRAFAAQEVRHAKCSWNMESDCQ